MVGAKNRGLRRVQCRFPHYDTRPRRCFGPFLIHLNDGLMHDCRNEPLLVDR